MGRPSQARIHLDALRHNYRWARQRHGGRALAVLKADAYGHGALRCARALAPMADGFAVAFVEEALALRDGGIEQPILVLEGAFDARDLVQIHAHRLWTVVHHEDQLRMIECAGGLGGLDVWLKLDSGMARLGLPLTRARTAGARLMETGRVASLTWMSHFARADEPGRPETLAQAARFEAALSGLPGPRSLCNSAGVLNWPAAHRDWARPGLMLYGVDPTPDRDHALRPVMSLRSQVFALRHLEAGDPLGYGGHFVARRPSRIGLVAMGYADGYPRTAPTDTPVVVDGLEVPLAGRVSMDMLAVDLTDHPRAGVGSAVELWGPQLDINRVAQAAGTIAYELMCHVQRVPRVYQESG